jgi:hypothetical protein
METKTPRGQQRKFTDDDLRRALALGTTPADFARQKGVSRQAVNKRVNQLQLTTVSAVVAPQESQRYVARQIDVMEQLALNVRRANLLMDACDDWLRDAEEPERYHIGPRGNEITVHYCVEIDGPKGSRIEKRKAPLDVLLAGLEELSRFRGEAVVEIGGAEPRHADPRELILKTQQETRSTCALVMDAIQKLTDARMLEEWRRVAVEEIGKESPDCARRIAQRLQRSIVLHAAFSGPDAIPAGAGGAVHA